MIFLSICIGKKDHYVAHFRHSKTVEVVLDASKCIYFGIFISTGKDVQTFSRRYSGQYPSYSRRT